MLYLSLELRLHMSGGQKKQLSHISHGGQKKTKSRENHKNQ